MMPNRRKPVNGWCAINDRGRDWRIARHNGCINHRGWIIGALPAVIPVGSPIAAAIAMAMGNGRQTEYQPKQDNNRPSEN